MRIFFAFLIAVLFIQPANAGLLGTELSLRVLAQATSTSTPFITSFERTALVDESIVEYPDVSSFFNPGSPVPPGFARSLVNVAIDVGDNYIDIDFDNSSPFNRFASGFENTYVFKFDNSAAVNILGGEIDSTVTTLGLQPSNVRFVGNELFVNVESLSFNPSSFARIKLIINGGNFNPDLMPKPFKFKPKGGVTPNSLVISNPIPIKGIKARLSPISIVNGEYAINCKRRAFTSRSGVVKNRQKVCVRHQAAPTPKTVTTTTLTIGGRNGRFSSKTK